MIVPEYIVSIPVWFNDNKEGIYINKIPHPVSIPVWFNDNFQYGYIPDVKTGFQFQYGSMIMML